MGAGRWARRAGAQAADEARGRQGMDARGRAAGKAWTRGGARQARHGRAGQASGRQGPAGRPGAREAHGVGPRGARPRRALCTC